MSDTPSLTPPEDSSPAVEVSGRIMIVAVIVLFMVIVFILFLHLYAKWFWTQRGEDGSYPPRRRRFVFAPTQDPPAALHRGLESSVLLSLPVVIFQSGEYKDGMECAVCLSEIVDGEKARLLPKCNHGFHVECIDMWFQSHTTCPLCRDTVGDTTKTSPTTTHEVIVEDNLTSGYSMNLPTNMLFWGGDDNQVRNGAAPSNQAEVSSSSSSSTSANSSRDGALVIEIPRRSDEGGSSFPPLDEMKTPTPTPPTPTRLMQLKRLLSRGKRVMPSSPGAVDVELGRVGKAQTSKTSSDS